MTYNRGETDIKASWYTSQETEWKQEREMGRKPGGGGGGQSPSPCGPPALLTPLHTHPWTLCTQAVRPPMQVQPPSGPEPTGAPSGPR